MRAEQLAFEEEQYGLSRGSITRPSALPTEQEEELRAEMDLPRLSHTFLAAPSPVGPPRPAATAGLLLRGQWGQAWSGLAGDRTHLATLFLLALLTAGWSVGAALETPHAWLRKIFFAALFGMPG